ncbi:MAG: protein phosphatase 2C domain-containing protein [Oscillospiraceae bacterium]|nr:protein phosphatase 2C domain-containing protein [Oscillospiraceae bacterium]
MRIWGVSDKGAVRSENQDAYYAAVEDDFALAVVCDGMGGTKNGAVASNMAVQSFTTTVRADLSDVTRRRASLEDAVAKAHDEINAGAKSNSEYSDMGTTLVAALLDDYSNCYVVNVGDSRCYSIHREIDSDGNLIRGEITQITKDHSEVQELLDRGDITPEEARTHPRRNVIMKALCPGVSGSPDIFEFVLPKGDYLLLCSDGLTNEVDQRELSFELLYGGSIETAAKRILDVALSREARDNVTVIIIEN